MIINNDIIKKRIQLLFKDVVDNNKSTTFDVAIIVDKNTFNGWVVGIELEADSVNVLFEYNLETTCWHINGYYGQYFDNLIEALKTTTFYDRIPVRNWNSYLYESNFLIYEKVRHSANDKYEVNIIVKNILERLSPKVCEIRIVNANTGQEVIIKND